MHAAVAGEEAEGQPAAVEAFGALGHEATYVIAPENRIPLSPMERPLRMVPIETGFGSGGVNRPSAAGSVVRPGPMRNVPR